MRDHTINLKIYLAGKMGGLTYDEMNGWRSKLTRILMEEADFADVNLNVINPVNYYNFEEQRYQTEAEVEEFDLMHLRSSDIVVVNIDGLSTSDGTKIELHDAKYHNRIPVLAFGDGYDDLHPWVKNDISRVEKTMEDLVTYIRDFYFL